MKRLIAFLALTAACSAERATAPAPTAQIMGDLPTNHLIGETPTFSYGAAEGGFTVHVAVDRGLFEAARHGNADFAVRVSLRIADAAGNGVVIVGGWPLALVKPLAEPRPDPFVEFSFSVPWDGTDASGNAMTGTVRVGYSLTVENRNGAVFEPNGEPILVGAWPVTGFFDVPLVDIP